MVSVTYSQVTASSEPIGDNPEVLPHNTGVGLRIFPDDDYPNDLNDRRQVLVTATLSQPIANVRVHFRSFDLDDPATDTTIDDPTFVNDNAGTPRIGQLQIANGCGVDGAAVFCPTNTNGVATVVFTATRQPGDNFAIAASVSPVQANGVNVNGIELTNSGGQNIPITCTKEPVCRSEMLTVWRRLHIEVDSMGNSIANRQLGRIASTTRIRVGQTVTVPVTASDGTTADLEPNRFEGGRLVVNFRSFRVTCNPTCNTATSVNVTGMGSFATLFANTPFELYDDDDYNDDDGPAPAGDGSLDGDTGEDIPPPDTALLTAGSDDTNLNVFASAYIHPVYDVVDPNDDTIFQANAIGGAAGDIRPLFVDRDLTTTNIDNEFWTVLLLGSYQFTLGTDNDSSTEPCPNPMFTHCTFLGIVDAITLISDDFEGSGALIFTELHRPRELPGYSSAPTNLDSMAVTVAHETAHLFSCEHGDGAIMGIDGAGAPVSNQYSPTMIRKIRVLMHP